MSAITFDTIKTELEQEATIKKSVEEAADKIDPTALCSALISTISSTPPSELLESTQLATMESELLAFRSNLQQLKQYSYKFHHLWNRHLQQHIFAHLLIHYIRTRELLPYKSVVSTVLELDVEMVDVEDYLHACVTLSNELARLSMTSVIRGDYKLPVDNLKFLTELFGEFQALNLKNDTLRRRYDSMKYDLKRAEEVVYNLKLRKFI